MTHILETRRLGRRASDMMSLGGDITEVAPNLTLFNQAKHISRRSVVSDALARALAELAFSNGGRR